MAIDREAATRALGAFLEALGHAPSARPELADTPRRVADAFADELLAGYSVDVAALLAEGCSPIQAPGRSRPVVLRKIAVSTLCPHHLLPALGDATVAYLPGDRLVGLGTLARLVDAFCRRLSLQEEIAEEVVAALRDHAGARAAHCQLTLRHTCLAARGARQARAVFQTAASGGQGTDELERLVRGKG